MSTIVISLRRGHLARSGMGIGIREGARIAQRAGVRPAPKPNGICVPSGDQSGDAFPAGSGAVPRRLN
jgi:hypothetical protein